MNKTVVFFILVVMAVMLSACGTTESTARVYQEQMTDTSKYVGGYNADVIVRGTGSTRSQYYYWEKRDVSVFTNTCVTLGYATVEITLYYSDGYFWEQNANEWCLKRN